jgi:hypothetical protein
MPRKAGAVSKKSTAKPVKADANKANDISSESNSKKIAKSPNQNTTSLSTTPKPSHVDWFSQELVPVKEAFEFYDLSQIKVPKERPYIWTMSVSSIGNLCIFLCLFSFIYFIFFFFIFYLLFYFILNRWSNVMERTRY